MLELGQLEELGSYAGEPVAVEPEKLQRARQVGEAAGLQRGQPIVVEKPERGPHTRELTRRASSMVLKPRPHLPPWGPSWK